MSQIEKKDKYIRKVIKTSTNIVQAIDEDGDVNDHEVDEQLSMGQQRIQHIANLEHQGTVVKENPHAPGGGFDDPIPFGNLSEQNGGNMPFRDSISLEHNALFEFEEERKHDIFRYNGASQVDGGLSRI